ncbi:MAG: VOC family protein [Gammaproteobacteria bacterium]|nr:VOC family protein [Gammaproteobacteria bacterium]
MDLGAFSVSLAVKDLAASMDFYGKLGFECVGGDPTQNWVILRNGDHVLGLFQDMFKENILTFNPGWGQTGNELESYTDVRDIQRKLKELGIALSSEADESSSGPASIMLSDPDGNQILIDQHR